MAEAYRKLECRWCGRVFEVDFAATYCGDCVNPTDRDQREHDEYISTLRNQRDQSRVELRNMRDGARKYVEEDADFSINMYNEPTERERGLIDAINHVTTFLNQHVGVGNG